MKIEIWFFVDALSYRSVVSWQLGLQIIYFGQRDTKKFYIDDILKSFQSEIFWLGFLWKNAEKPAYSVILSEL